MTRPDGYLNVPDVERVEFERNFIRLTVCELRFPTLLELEQECPPAFQKALRKLYPHYERAADISLHPSGGRDSEARYIFRSLKRDWTVSLRSSAFALETQAYENFEDFLKRLAWVVQQAAEIIDSDFFTRVGLRYVNVIPVKGDPSGWLRDDIIKPLTDNVLGNPAKYWQNISGATTDGQYNFRHGLEDGLEDNRSYILDFDFYREEVAVKELENFLVAFNAQNFKLFRWAIGDKALAYLGKAMKKR